MVSTTSVVSYVITVILMLVNVAFLTLLERKVLACIQLRKGPNKLGFLGILQPFSDAIKLFMKEMTFVFSSNYKLYFLAPIFSMIISMVFWIVLPLDYGVCSIDYSWLFLLMLISLSIYPLLISGWSSNSKFSYLGAIRGVAQIISSEVIFSLLVFFVLYMSKAGVNTESPMFLNQYVHLLFYFPFVYVLWMFICVMESNRTPFDFSEGESELVSGFNTEYSGGGFTLIFLSEYLSILFLSSLGATLLNSGSGLVFFFVFIANSFLWLWLRGTYVRYRYDIMMKTAWKSILPFVGNFILFIFLIEMVVMAIN